VSAAPRRIVLAYSGGLETFGGVHGTGGGDAIVARPDGTTSGSTRLRLFKGDCRAAGRAARVAVNTVS
jgi:hypothetical protein